MNTPSKAWTDGWAEWWATMTPEYGFLLVLFFAVLGLAVAGERLRRRRRPPPPAP